MAKDHQQLPWDKAADLSARLAAIPIFKSPPPSSYASEVLTRFLRPRGRGTVSEELLDRYQYAQRHLNTLDAQQQAALNRPMADLLQIVQQIDCTRCAGKGSECRGADESQDDARLSQPGLCIELLHGLFRDVVVRYGAAIDLWAYDGVAEHRRDLAVYLSTRAQPESAYDRAGPEWKVCGSTRFVDEEMGRRSAVKLSIAIDVLDWPSLRASFWILVHEFVFHAQQGRPRSEARKSCDPSCPLYEGWMDEIAMRLLNADLNGQLFPKAPSSFVSRHASALLQSAGDYRCARYGWGPGAPRHKYATQWELGVNAVGAVDRFLQSFDRHDDRSKAERALAPLVRLSFRLMAHAPDSLLAARIVTGLLTAPETAYGKEAHAQGALYELLTRPITDLRSWINRLESLA